MKKQASVKRFKNSRAFGTALGLSALEMEVIEQKKKLTSKLKAIREKRNITQATLAKMVGSKQPAIARMESGLVSEVSLDFLIRVALALEAPVTIRPLKHAA